MNDAKEEVRARLAIEDVVGDYVELKRAGRSHKGLSPFTSERTPSFFVSPDKQIWHDFSSNKGGDVFSFVMEMEGLEFREALEMLARRAGVELSQYDARRSGEVAQKRQRFIKAHQLAARYYQQQLLKSKPALEYVIKNRGFGRQVIGEFQIGYAPDTKDGLVSMLKAKGFQADELNEAGLTNRYGGDLFRSRIMIPLMDGQGQVIGFTGRALGPSDGDTPKYFNTRQTLVYDKGRHVFGLSQAKEAIRTSGYAIVTEGNLDVVSSHQVDIKPVVATAGTAMTAHHLKALARLAPSVRLAFDNDRAGLAATERAIEIAAEINGLDLSVVSLPAGYDDPDELIRQDAAAWQEVLDTPLPAVDWVMQQYQNQCDLTTAAGKRDYTGATLGVVRRLRDPVEREHYLQEIADTAGVSLMSIQQKLGDAGEKPPVLKRPKQDVSQEGGDLYAYQDVLLAMACIDTGVQQLLAEYDIEKLQGEQRQAVAKVLAGLKKPLAELPSNLNDHATYGKILLFMAETHYAEWTPQERHQEAVRLLSHIKTEHLKSQQNELTNQLRNAEQEGDESTAATLRQQLNELIKEIARGR